MLTPVGALALSAVVLGEHPTALQLAGSVTMLASAYAATADLTWSQRRRRRTPAGRP